MRTELNRRIKNNQFIGPIPQHEVFGSYSLCGHLQRCSRDFPQRSCCARGHPRCCCCTCCSPWTAGPCSPLCLPPICCWIPLRSTLPRLPTLLQEVLSTLLVSMVLLMLVLLPTPTVLLSLWSLLMLSRHVLTTLLLWLLLKNLIVCCYLLLRVLFKLHIQNFVKKIEFLN